MTKAERCPRDWRLHYNPPSGEREEEETQIQIAGRAAHEVIAAYLKHLRKMRLQSDILFVDDLMRRPPASLEALNQCDPATFRDVWTIGRRFADGWIDPLDPDAVIEEWFEAKLDVEMGEGLLEEVALVGVIDRLSQEDGGPVVTDWKTGWGSLSPSQMKRDPQTRLYAFAALHDENIRRRAFPHGDEPITIRHVYPRLGMMVREAEIHPIDFMNLEAEIAQRVRNWWAVTEGKTFEPNPGYHCSFCAFRRDCPAILDARYGYPAFLVTSDEEAITAARQVLAMNAARAEQLAALRAWVDESGPVEVDERVLGYHVTDAPAIADIHQAVINLHKVPGITPGELFDAPVPKLRDALKTYPLLAEVLGDNLTKKQSARFAFSKLEYSETDEEEDDESGP
ncbi:MAG: DUF2800 domain-containing protein [Thermoplasmata archaeon]|nr:DUF2800 domain-containing protein [Thermoplasmata archaeon]NIY05139.1 DUF2800 domain-containing protein [Thermoplasmata archaeon]